MLVGVHLSIPIHLLAKAVGIPMRQCLLYLILEFFIDELKLCIVFGEQSDLSELLDCRSHQIVKLGPVLPRNLVHDYADQMEQEVQSGERREGPE